MHEPPLRQGLSAKHVTVHPSHKSFGVLPSPQGKLHATEEIYYDWKPLGVQCLQISDIALSPNLHILGSNHTIKMNTSVSHEETKKCIFVLHVIFVITGTCNCTNLMPKWSATLIKKCWSLYLRIYKMLKLRFQTAARVSLPGEVTWAMILSLNSQLFLAFAKMAGMLGSEIYRLSSQILYFISQYIFLMEHIHVLWQLS